MNNKIDKKDKFKFAMQANSESLEVKEKRYQDLLNNEERVVNKDDLRKEIELEMQRKYANKIDVKPKHVLLDKNYCRKLDLLKSETNTNIKDLLRSMVEEKIDQELKKLSKNNPALSELLKSLS